jgi:DNA topoisomerase-1
MMQQDTNYYMTQYWLEMQFGGKGKKRWSTLQHNGVLFPPEYVEHNIPVIYNGEKVELYKDAEEAATMYAKYTDTEYINSSVFKRNFWKDWKKILGPNHIIKDLEGVDFSLIYAHLLKLKEDNKTDDRKKSKEQRDIEEMKYKTAIVNGVEEPVGNYKVEPPGIFIGRGCHPELGRIKKRILPGDITINIGKDVPIPPTPDGSKWGRIIHDKTVTWLASWTENILGKVKYVWLGNKSSIKAESDKKKFDMAKKLKKNIKNIREQNYKNISSNDIKEQQIAVALYLIDNLALRVGNEKGEDEADTVGVTSLRVEHIQLHDKHSISLNFLGKDSIRYMRTISVDPLVHNKLNDFMKSKNKNDQLFDKITPSMMNKYLQSFMKNLTTKVFRTYNASYLFQKELNKVSKKFDKIDGINFLLDQFNKANLKVAILCNHQKKISASYNTQIDGLNTKIKLLQKKKKNAKNNKQKDALKLRIKKLKAQKQLKIETKNYSLGTSKTNYIDPRITVAFSKKHNIPIDLILSKQIQEKFWWAFDVDENYKF